MPDYSREMNPKQEAISTKLRSYSFSAHFLHAYVARNEKTGLMWTRLYSSVYSYLVFNLDHDLSALGKCRGTASLIRDDNNLLEQRYSHLDLPNLGISQVAHNKWCMGGETLRKRVGSTWVKPFTA